MIRSYKDLDVWQRAMSLAEAIYTATSSFPKDEMFAMTAQMRRAEVSVAANIAEGYGRDSTQSYIQFLRISQGSLKELETHVMIAQRVKLLADDPSTPLLSACDDVGKMLRNLIRALESKSQR